MSPKAKPKSQPPFSASSAWHRSGVIAFMRPLVSSGVSTFVACGFMWPSIRNTGGRPVVMWMSLTPFFTAAVSSLSMSTVPVATRGVRTWVSSPATAGRAWACAEGWMSSSRGLSSVNDCGSGSGSPGSSSAGRSTSTFVPWLLTSMPWKRPRLLEKKNFAGSACGSITAAAIASTSSAGMGLVFRGRIWSLMRSIGETPPESRSSVAPLSSATLSSFSTCVAMGDTAAVLIGISSKGNHILPCTKRCAQRLRKPPSTGWVHRVGKKKYCPRLKLPPGDRPAPDSGQSHQCIMGKIGRKVTPAGGKFSGRAGRAAVGVTLPSACSPGKPRRTT